jgi:hypothetical protein
MEWTALPIHVTGKSRATVLKSSFFDNISFSRPSSIQPVGVRLMKAADEHTWFGSISHVLSIYKVTSITKPLFSPTDGLMPKNMHRWGLRGFQLPMLSA